MPRGQMLQRPLAVVVFSLCSLAIVFAGCARENAKPSGAGGSAASNPPAAGGLPPDAVAKAEKLIQVTSQYNALAKQVQDAASFKQHWDELSRLDREASSAAEDVSIAEAKLTAGQRDEFNRTYFEGKAKPLIDEKRQQQQRLRSIAPQAT